MTQPKDFLDEMIQSRKKKNHGGKPKRGSAGTKSKTSATRNLKPSGCQAIFVTRLENGRAVLLALSGLRGRVSVVGLLPVQNERYVTMERVMTQLARSHGSLEKSLSYCPLEPTELVEIYSSFRETCSVVCQETEPSLNRFSAERIAKVNSRMKSLYKSGSTRPGTETRSSARKR